MTPTPDLSHLSQQDLELIYEPAEDTFLLLDALEEDADQLRALHPSIYLEIGSGSGCVSAFTSSILGNSVLYLCTDINPYACKFTLSTGNQNQAILHPIRCSLAGPLASRLHHSVDVLIFNPPYVPTVEREALDAQRAGDIAGSWAGGLNGMQVTNMLLDQVEGLLSEKGRFYLVAVKENNIPDLRQRMQDLFGLQSEIVMQRRAGREHLHIVRFSRQGYP